MRRNCDLKKSTLKYVGLAWILFGILIIAATYFSYTNGFKKLSFSIHNNYINEINHNTLNYPEVKNGGYDCWVWVHLDNGENNYLRIVAEDIGDSKAKCIIKGLTEKEEEVLTIGPGYLTDGNNDFEIANQDFRVLRITVVGPDHQVVKRAEFRQTLSEYPVKDALKYMIAAALVYISLTGGAILAIKKYCFKPKAINEISPVRDEKHASIITKNSFKLPIPGEIASIIRTGLWLLMISLSLLLQMKGEAKGYRDHCMQYIHIEIGIVLLLALMTRDKDYRAESVRIDLSMFMIIGVYAIYTLLSDIIVDKIPAFAGIEVFAVLIVYSYTWVTSSTKYKYLYEVERAIHLFLVVFLIITLIYNKDYSAERYSGPFDNASIFALYLAAIWAVLIASLEESLYNSHFIKKVILIGELAIVGFLIIKSQSLTPAISVVFVTAIFFLRRLSKRYGVKKIATVTLATTLLLLLIAVVLFRSDAVVIKGDSRLIQKFKTGDMSLFLSGRDYYYRCYLRKLNILGHHSKPFLGVVGRKILPHNALIQQAYVYGTPILIPYILMMTRALDKAITYARKAITYSSLPLYGISAFLVMSLTDNVDRYFIWLPWIMCYMMFAPLIFEPDNAITMKIENA